MEVRSIYRSLFLSCFVFLLSTALFAQMKVSQLPKHYREWLQKDVVYIINNDEKKAFLSLATDAERDKFIDHFWEIRNPNPGAPSNAFKDEHYRRIEFANSRYGKEDGTEGWRTDRGRIYITLGPPKQTNRLIAATNLWPMEIWFYSNGHPALPPHFYVLFYQKEGYGDFKIYSPYMDGPEKLVSTLRENNRVQAYREIRNVAGAEVARNSLTLLTDEPIDTENATSSLQSDVMISTIKDLPNNPVSKDMLRQRQQNLEMVRSHVILGEEFLKVFYVPLRDSEGNINLHYLLSLKSAQDFAVGKQDDRYYYNVVSQVTVMDTDGKTIYSRVAPLSKYMTEAEFEKVKGKTFGVEGWIPIAPGKYKVRFQLTNKVNNNGFRVEKEVGVPTLPSAGYQVAGVVGFREAEPAGAKGDSLPFSFGGIKFTPLAPPDEMDFRPGDDLNVLYQIWTAQGLKPGNLKATYTYGKLNDRTSVKTVEDDVSSEQFNAAGSMINGKKLSTVGMEPGNYILTIALNDPATSQRAFSSARFRLLSEGQPTRFWRLADETMSEEVAKGTVDLNRAMVYQSAKLEDQAIGYYRLALQRNPENHQARARLADVLASHQRYADVVALFAQVPITKEDGEGAVVQYAESLTQTGDTPRAIATLESALKWGANSKPVYLSLANAYRKSGNTARAEELVRQSETAAVAR